MNRRDMLRRLAIGASGLVVADSVRDFLEWETRRVFALGGISTPPRDRITGRWISAHISGWHNGQHFSREIGPECITEENGVYCINDITPYLPSWSELSPGTYNYSLNIAEYHGDAVPIFVEVT